MNIAVAQSGGPTCAINASLLGVIKEALRRPEIGAIYGSINGIEGIIDDRLVDLKKIIRTNEDMELLRQTPSTVLGSCRYKLPAYDENSAVFERIVACFDKHKIEAFFYIGGNDSMDTVAKLSRYLKEIGRDIRVIGVPKTIDNDLCETDHTPGFGSAAKYVATSVQEITRDSSVYSIQSVTIVEIMGRHAGWLAASAAALHANGEASPHLIYLPECPFDKERFLSDVAEQLTLHKAVIVVVSEGISLKKAEEQEVHQADGFGHLAMSGIGKELEKLVAERFSIKVRSIELNVMQRCASHISSRTDIHEAEQCGQAAVAVALSGETGKMMRIRRVLDMPYTVVIEPVDADLVANKERFFPKRWINEKRNNVTNDALPYFLPLIQGEQIIKMQNGLPVHYKVGNILDCFIDNETFDV